ncbi:MAG TPA: amidohydrolase family protein [Conexibacter sp.]|nr:amidohydrolase family protein [Conexibacter sp.]
MPALDLALNNGRVALSDGRIARVNVGVRDGRIATITDEALDAERTLDVEGLVVLPGLVDQHFHSWWGHEDWETHTCATRAAAKGGVTSLVEMPLDMPLTITAQALHDKLAIVGGDYYVDYAAFGGYLDTDPDEIARMAEAGVVAFKLFTGDVAPPGVWPGTPDGQALDMMRRVAHEGRTLVAHCENADLVEFETARLQAEGRDGSTAWDEARPWFAEVDAVQRLALLAEVTGCRTVIAHLPTPRCVEAVRDARKRGADVWAETCPHQLCVTREDMTDTRFKWNPPTRDRAAVDRLWQMLAAGEIHSIGSDHAPLAKKPGANIWDQNPGAGNVLETMLPVVASEAHERGIVGLPRLVEVLATTPAKLFGLYPRKGAIQVGADADFAVIETTARRTVDARELEFHNEASRWSPYEGRAVSFFPVYTILRGETIFAEGEVTGEPGYGRFLAADADRTAA